MIGLGNRLRVLWLVLLGFGPPTSAVVAFACGPNAVTRGTPVRGLTPLDTHSIRLESAKVRIRLLDDGDHFLLRATYRMYNEGGSGRVLFGVPVIYHEDQYESEKVRTELNRRKALRSIRVRYRSKDYRCKPSEKRYADVPNKEIPTQDSEFVSQWCTISLRLPQRSPVVVGLTYRGELAYEDGSDKASGEPLHNPRILSHLALSTQRWKGRIEKLEVVIETGKFADAVRNLSPAGFRRRRGRIRYRWRGIALDRVPRVSAEVHSQSQLRHTYYSEHNRKQGYRLAARASSTLGKRYAPRNLLDGRPRTAWCEGRKGVGLGQWVELRLHKVPQFGLNPKLGLVPGYAKSQWSYRANGRVKKVRVSLCRDPKVSQVFTLNLPRRFDRSLQVLALGGKLEAALKQEISGYDYDKEENRNRDEEGGEDGEDQGTAKKRPVKPMLWRKRSRAPCLRFTILQVEKGTRYADTCVGEITPLAVIGWMKDAIEGHPR